MPLNLPLTITRTGAASAAAGGSKPSQLVVEFDLKTKPQGLDIDLTPWSITVNQRPYFARSYFSGEVNVEGASTVVNDAAKKVRMIIPLKEASSGDAGASFTLKEDEAASLGLPAKIDGWKSKRVAQVKASGSQAAKTASDLALHSGMAADSAVKDRMEAAEKIEKDKATADVFRALEGLQQQQQKPVDAVVEKPAPATQASAATMVATTTAASLKEAKKEIYHEDEEQEEAPLKANKSAEDDLPASVSLPTRTLPPPRGATTAGSTEDGSATSAAPAVVAPSKATLSFTPRVLPTPLRESKVAEENEYLLQQQLAQQAAKARAAAAANASGTSTADAAKANAEEMSKATQAYYRGLAFAEAGDLSSALSAFQTSADKYDALITAAGSAGSVNPNDPISIRRGQAASKAAACAYSLGRPYEETTRYLSLWLESSKQAHDAVTLSKKKDGSIAASVIMASGGGFSSPAAVIDDLVRQGCLQQVASASVRPPVVTVSDDLLGGSSTTLPALLAALIDIQSAAVEEDRLRTIGKLVGAAQLPASEGSQAEEAEEEQSAVQLEALSKAVEVAPFKLLAWQNVAAFHLQQQEEEDEEGKGGDGSNRKACLEACNKALDGVDPHALREAVLSSKALTTLLATPTTQPQQQQQAHRYLKAFASLCVMRAECTLEEAGGEDANDEEALSKAVSDYERALIATPDDADIKEQLEELRARRRKGDKQ
jgi:tetratricopeptide (TPR) repeat protein